MKRIGWTVTVGVLLSCALLVGGISTASAVVEATVGKLSNKPKPKFETDEALFKCKPVAKQITVTNVGQESVIATLSMYIGSAEVLTGAEIFLSSFTVELGPGEMIETKDDKTMYKLKKKVEPALLDTNPYVLVNLVYDTMSGSGGGEQLIFVDLPIHCREFVEVLGTGGEGGGGGRVLPGPLATGKFAAAAYIAVGLSGIGDPQSANTDDNMGDSDGGGGGDNPDFPDFDPDDPGGFPGLPPGCDITKPETCIPESFKSSSIAPARTPQSSTKAQIPLLCASGGTSNTSLDPLNPLDSTISYENCGNPVDTTGDGVDDAVEIKDGSITITSTDTGNTVVDDLTTRRERLDGQFISEDIISVNVETTNTQTEDCVFPGAPAAFPIPVQTSAVSTTTTQETADTNGDGAIDKDVDTTGNGVSNVTLGVGLTSLCDAFVAAGDGDLDIAVGVAFSGTGSWTDNLSGQTVTSSIDPNNPVMMTFMTSTVGGEPQSSVDGGGTITTSGLDCLPGGSVTFQIVVPVVLQGIGNAFVGGQMTISGIGGTGVVNITQEGIEVVGDDGTTGYLNPDWFGDPFWWCSNEMPQ